MTVNGRVSALLELGAGFNPEFTGRDNVYLNGSILGLSTREIDQRYKEIEDFAEIGDFINQPVKTYSSGMVVRLAFAVAINVDPEILLVDEALAVGDIYFRQRCMRKVHELRARGITILFVSHAVGDVKAIGDRVLWLDHGRMTRYRRNRPGGGQVPGRHGGKGFRLSDAEGAGRASAAGDHVRAPGDRRPHPEYRPSLWRRPRGDSGHRGARRARPARAACWSRSQRIIVRISVRANEDVAQPIVGFMMRNHLGVDFSGTNTAREGYELPAMSPGDIYTVDFHLDLPELYPASFSFSPAIADGTLLGYKMCDWIDNAIALQMGHSRRPDLRLSAPALPRGSECPPRAAEAARHEAWRESDWLSSRASA